LLLLGAEGFLSESGEIRRSSNTLLRSQKEGGLGIVSKSDQLGRTFSFILKRMVETGQAPFYTEISEELGVSVEEGRKALHDLVAAAIAVWLFPNTNYIASFPPFSNLPTQYRITIDGQQKWFGQ